MNDDVKAAIDEIANAMQVINLCRRACDRTSANQRNTRLISRGQQPGLFAR